MKSVNAIYLLLLFAVAGSANAADPISLEEALNRRLVKVTAKGKGQQRGINQSNHFGKCMEMTMQNLSSAPLTVRLECGRVLNPADSHVQNMLVTRQEFFVLPYGGSQKKDVYAMCAEMHDAAPQMGTIFRQGRMGNSKLQGIAKFLQKHHVQNGAGQAAVWCVSDRAPLHSITSADSSMQRMLRAYTTSISGMPAGPAHRAALASPAQQERSAGVTTFHFDFSLAYRSKVSLLLYDDEGRLMKKYYFNQWLDKGSYSKTYTISTAELKEGLYSLEFILNEEETFRRRVVLGDARVREEAREY